MTTEPRWKISLAPSAPERPRTVIEREEPQDRLAYEKLTVVANKLAAWLGIDYVADMTSRDISALVSALEGLRGGVSTNSALWTAVPDATTISDAEKLVASFRDARAEADGKRKASSAFIEHLGIIGGGSIRETLASAAITHHRYETSLQEIVDIARLLRRALHIKEPSLEDVSFLSGVLPSLKSMDTNLLCLATPTADELSVLRSARECMSDISERMKTQFGFEPILHKADALGGIRRAFATKKAPDFLSAARKLGAVVNDADQAHKAALMMREYLAADDIVTSIADRLSQSNNPSSATAGRIKESLVERIKLVQSLERRRSVITFNEGSLSPGLSRLGQDGIDPELFEATTAMNADTRKLVEDNIKTVGGSAAATGLIDHLGLIVAGLNEWITQTNDALRRSGADDMSPGEFEAYLDKHPVEVESFTIDYSISTDEEAAEIDRHVAWIREAAMLPLSDEKLAAYLARRGVDGL